MSHSTNSRRQFLQRTLCGTTALVIPWGITASGQASKARPIRIGICADPHKDIMHDADHRLQVFIDRMKLEKVDFILQMGDFCIPFDYNLGFLKIWKEFKGPRYHVLGNHDMDDSPGLDVSELIFTREETVAFWGMKAKYYSFDRGGYHFVVLDGNEHNPQPWTGYFRYIGPEQLNWLKEDLAQTTLSTIVFSHQSLENFEGIDNREEVRKVLEEANSNAGFRKVIACFSGHHHIDYHTQINGIYYLQVNSMSYQWLGEKYEQIRFSQEVDNKHPWIKYTAPYKDSLYAIVTLDPKGKMIIEGVRSEFVGPSPKELGRPEQPIGNRTSSSILDKSLDIELD